MRYFVYDVFTDTPFGGNQLAIIPDAGDLTDAQMQTIAREFNFSETSFVLPPKDPGHTARVRYFTPARELPFAGHPTIGTAVMMADENGIEDMVLELGVGPLSCRAAEGCASFFTEHPLEVKGHPAAELVAHAMGCEIGNLRSVPVLASLGGDFVYAQLDNRETLSKLCPDIEAMREGAALYPGNHDFAVYPYVLEGNTVHARMFAPLDGIPEDPATGSAAAPLAALLCKTLGRRVEITVHQGDDMGRPSRIALTADQDRVTVTGKAVKVMEGTLFL
ncbi:PhzF family phenazine biosynthesis protein [Aliiroseovarius sp. KMU-50]|uniref:PhzF family phenazine biosynthesis protein n=1 Tax=Aliiroseovarius salicola TaxID=3009082 RepID=A0ABT4W1J7_9RHOB|nr:PhzF family phenazine biosynthesis protein [Aliiroseovarius sp. KMU-50]MDA5094294.1 PhzF family phenazine biosynthesis protein [Aliiroseovarius sp. KMU-50]